MARQNFSFLVCPDAALSREKLDETALVWGDAHRLTFWGDEEPGDAFWGNLQQRGLFAEKRIIIVRNAELWSAAIWKTVARILARPQEDVWPFFCMEVDAEKGNFKIPAHILNSSCFRFAEKKGWVWKHAGLQGDCSAFVKHHASQMGLNFSSQLLSRFCNAVPPNARQLLNELQKLSLLAPDGNITSEILPEGDADLETDAFDLLPKLWAADLPALWQQISRDTEGNLLFFIIAILSRDLRILWQILAGENPRLYPTQAQAKKKIANKLGFTGIAQAFAAVADAEWQVKSGRLQPPQALESLLVNILGLYAPSKLLSR